jgi:2-desacetyl-2-hydroxyethyl bacteriochlorophyllide A dehydrogenase
MIAEPLAIAVHAKRVADIHGGETVSVVGCGPIGLLTMKVLDLAGADVVLAVEPVEERREAALECGAGRALSPDEDPVGVLKDMTGGRLADIVVEAAGPPDALRLAMRLVRPGGTLVYAGIHPGQMAIDFTLARRREMVWKWVRRTVNAYPETIELLASGKIDGKRFVTHHWPMEQAREAFQTAAAYRDGIIKGAVDVTRGR